MSRGTGMGALALVLSLGALALSIEGRIARNHDREWFAQMASQASAPTLPPAPAPVPVVPLPSADLSSGEASMSDVVARVLPAVVNITMLSRQGQGAGSGVVIDAEGLVVTNAHVVEGAVRVMVNLSDGRELAADIVGADPQTDIALLRLQGRDLDLTPLEFGDSNRLRQGDVVLAIGNPFGVGQTVTMGIVSATGRAEMRIAEYEDFIQTDAAINPGNSGGALVAMNGQLVGINAAILSRTGGSHGIGFAIPTNMVRPIVQALLRNGKVIRGWLGVTIQSVTPELASAMSLSSPRGVIVTGIEEGSPAAAAGLRVGDVIAELDGERMNSPRQLSTMVATRGADAALDAVVQRGSERLAMTFTLAERPMVPLGQQMNPSTSEPRPVPSYPSDPRWSGSPGIIPGLPPLPPGARPAPSPRQEGRAIEVAGILVTDLDARARSVLRVGPEVRGGAVVVDVRQGTPGAESGLSSGDIVMEVNRAPIASAAQFAQMIARAGHNAVLRVRRGGGTLYLVIR